MHDNPSTAGPSVPPAVAGPRPAKGPPTSSMLRRRLTHVPARLPVLVRLPNQRLKSVELHPGRSVSLGKYGSFKADDIVGLPYGLTFEIVGNAVAGGEKKGRKGKGGRPAGEEEGGEVSDVRIVLEGDGQVEELEDNKATNETIGDDDGRAQTMTYLDIKALKDSGAAGRTIIEQEVASNATFAQRTSWSQQKFILRKEAKHLRLFTPVAPTLTNVMRHVQERYERDLTDKIRGLRADSLSYMLSLAGVGPGRRYVVVDGVGGLLTGAVLERMGGEGRVVLLNDADSPPALDLMTHFSLPSNTVDAVLRTMHWACTEPDWQSLVDPGDTADVTPAGRPANDRDRQRFRKRRAALSSVERVRAELFDGQFDGLLIASAYEPVSMIERLLPYLAGSANVVVHSPYLQTLAEAHAVLRLSHALINVSVTEPFQRRYQVLPGRMHPEMMTSAAAGYVLHGIRVLEGEGEEEGRAKRARAG